MSHGRADGRRNFRMQPQVDSRKDPSSHQRQGVTGRNGQPTAFMRKDRRD